MRWLTVSQSNRGPERLPSRRLLRIQRRGEEDHRPSGLLQRGEAPVGDIPAAVANLVEHYESDGDMALHLLRQEQRVPAYAISRSRHSVPVHTASR